MFKYLLFFLTLLTAQAHSFTLSDAMIDAEIRKVNGFVSADSNGIKVDVTGKGYSASSPYFRTTTTVPKPTFMGFVKGNMKSLVKKSPYYIAWAATIGAAGWAIDELTGQITGTAVIKKGSCYGEIWMISFPTHTTKQDCLQSMLGFVNVPLDYYNHPVFREDEKTIVWSCLRPGAPSYGVCISWQEKSTETQPNTPISEAQLYDSIAQHMTANPDIAPSAFMSPGTFPYPYPQLFPNPLKYIPGISEADYPALDCYFKGNLQSSNPGGACYVTESEYQRISEIGEKIKNSQSTDGQISGSNEQLKDPLTQAQLEETLNKLGDIGTDGVTDDASKIYDEGFKQLNESILADALPGMPELVPLPQFQTGSCRSLTLNFSFAGQNITKEFPGKAGCEQIEKMKEFLGWFLAVMVVMTLIFTALKEAN
ncbi:hypothetical protein [Aeromonas enteropelogenes]|uniref:hypothetical protein n=1 Tax=Aeromonas enteropelogenes TaxID=29489 RepID=UPI003BA02C31